MLKIQKYGIIHTFNTAYEILLINCIFLNKITKSDYYVRHESFLLGLFLL